MTEAREIIRADHRQYGVHMSHCNEGENLGGCKYGEDDICPALSGDPAVHTGMHPKQLERQAAYARFAPMLTSYAGSDKIKAVVFRHKPGWLNEERHFAAAFAEEQYAREFCAAMEGQEYTWTVVTIHHSYDDLKIGTVCEFNGGLQVSRLIV
jgi:hypothetical protein